MALILNDNFTYTDDGPDLLYKEVEKRINFYIEATKSINEIDLVFLKSCGYYELIIDEILKNIGIKDLDKIGIAVKIKTLINIIQYEKLKESSEEYLKMTGFRNSIAHDPKYRLEDDDNFYIKILKVDKESKNLNTKLMLMQMFTRIYSAPLFIITGISLQNNDNDNNFLKFNKI